MISRRRLIQLASIVTLAVVGLVDRPAEADAATNCTFCIESCNVDLEQACNNQGCGTNAPSCYLEGGCGGSMGSAYVVCMPI